MRAIKIDSLNKIVSEIEIDEENSLSGMQGVVDGLIEFAFELKNGDTLFVNEEGLFSATTFFEIKGAHQPFAGNGVIVGTNFSTGETVDAESSLDEIRSMVSFLSVEQVREKFRH